ncbi:GNAT family N-acetyltransferase [Kitasatospora paranensis]|uniref:GNAT family N-acetyltransferase n=1 Tax=Kitasatospora paranensis TaxID=258053 RepID=A0ABW2FY00_9ACTN
MRTASDADLPALRAIARASLVHDEDAETVVDLLWAEADRHPSLRVVAELDGVPVGFALGSVRAARDTAPRSGHLNLLAVHPEHRGLGRGRALLAALERRLAAEEVARLVVRGNPPNYAWPGIDIRYTPAVCLAESSGYVRGQEGLNMRVDLRAAPLDTAQDEQRLARAGVAVRRLRAEDEPAFRQWMLHWGGAWEGEGAKALSYDPPRGHVAVRDEPDGARFVGFACWGVNRLSWFGPMGTESSERGLGVGTVLLRRCLADQRAEGLEVAEIGWTAPIHFYALAVGATLGRVFWTYTKDLG